MEQPSQIPIPPTFQSVYHDDLFHECFGCQCDLLGQLVPYAVAKHIVVAEPVFEMALCLNCVATLQSKETQERVSAFVKSLLLERRSAPAEGYTWEDGISACLICERPKAACRRYQLLGVCMQRDLLVSAPPTPTPYLICEDCNEQLSQLLSQETRENWDRFMAERNDDPPGIELESPRRDPVFV